MALRAACVLLFLLGSGCGPIEYVNQVTRKASSQVEAARAVGADRHAPYYYTLATEYLRKAREEAAHADYQAANRFGRKSEEAARKAREVALEGRNPEPEGPSIEEEVEESLSPLRSSGEEGRR